MVEGCIADSPPLAQDKFKSIFGLGSAVGCPKVEKAGEFARWLLKVRRVVGRLPVLDGIIAVVSS